MPVSLCIKDFLLSPGSILDVRSPSEYKQGHLPGSLSFPLFTDDERALVGTLYKRKSRQEAIEAGLDLMQAKLPSLISQADALLNQSSRVLCWRGGMRSGFIARFLEALGYSAVTLQGGYKAFRRHVIRLFNQLAVHPPRFFILGGFTGSGKTAILQVLRQGGEQVVDLEQLACHRGSVFGGIDLPEQPSQEHFENQLAFSLEQFDWTRPIWLEDESRLIGKRHLPTELFQIMQQSPLFFLDCPFEERLDHLMHLYGQASTFDLLEAIRRITKRLGSQLTGEVSNLIRQGHKRQAVHHLLTYYDKAYHYQLAKRQHVYSLTEPCGSIEEWALHLQTAAKRISL
ncbi:tRNA 2-selenouridine(34) synthase MnmH [Candidatus Protochlamydia phocaeensis]|uniref:tRNA 2-selenouridine(34) synthase MnmH n=1 Tax=Candidatus Protochlamydia phocaeensis TaxID=1414722 RepID=UPI000838A8F0|nr:tRNA 2-selenouridine(34) synthase MnmH [Candidatus Protochlamydia phocaeensis]